MSKQIWELHINSLIKYAGHTQCSICIFPSIWGLSAGRYLFYHIFLVFFFFAQKISDDRYEFLTGTDHAIPHLYDINTFQCYLSSNIPETSPSGAINQACNYLFISITNCELPNTTVMLIISVWFVGQIFLYRCHVCYSI